MVRQAVGLFCPAVVCAYPVGSATRAMMSGSPVATSVTTIK